MHGFGPGLAACGACLAFAGCGQRQVEIIGSIPDGAVPVPCPPTLAERLAVVEIPVDRDIAWQRPGYDRFPVDERLALAVQPDGQAQLAWLEVSPATVAGGPAQPPVGVHVTPLGTDLRRRAGQSDALVPTGEEVAGLVAHDDGFALLTRDLNPGAPIHLDDIPTVAYLVRFRDGAEWWRKPLTGDLSESLPEANTLYSPFLDGQLAWNGSVYGAYFVVRGGVGDPAEGFWRDALVFRDSLGGTPPPTMPQLAHGCQNNGGIRLIRDRGKSNLMASTWATLPDLTGLCVQQASPELKLTSLEAHRFVSDQEVSWAGYAGARLGSLVKVADGYLVFWLSQGDAAQAELRQGHDIRMARLDHDFNVVAGPTWVTRTPGTQEWNLHVAPYGENHLLMIYEDIAISGSAFDHGAMYLGTYRGTHLALLDGSGLLLADELLQDRPLAITANAEPVLLPGGDVAWPFVNPSPDYTSPTAEPNGPGQTTLRIARVRYCL